MIGKDYGLIDKNINAPLSGTHLDTITIKIAPAGTIYTNEAGEISHSKFGHAWVEFQGESIGWGTGETKEIGGADNITFKDSAGYDQFQVTSITYPLYTEQVIKNIENYLSDVINGVFDGEFGSFPKDYHLLKNNCIKFVNSILAITREGGNVDAIPDLIGISPNMIIDNMECSVQVFKEIDSGFPFDLTGADIINLAENSVISFEKYGGFAQHREFEQYEEVFDQGEDFLEPLNLQGDAIKENVTNNNELSALSEAALSAISILYEENEITSINNHLSINGNDGNTMEIASTDVVTDEIIHPLNVTIDIVGVNNSFNDMIL
ncbi:hypothetical protein Xmau_04295 [Xenorhabdus mauleonii]|uniref:Uncharacterized protein n=1 Tax=Xenorhabdus mauleonii TaxID=351675 RepID=A0A1I3XU41_9GAMM|nr:hypothetical protein [Xenorhabdus mauleonii]PHM36286.1 hypothetical protein Xmau_04295 [Xenorhabdus mauleonii]SFK22516.1 hypothetical protein SAMN05421680_13815 [Xenorhabdus mauleonii]